MQDPIRIPDPAPISTNLTQTPQQAAISRIRQIIKGNQRFLVASHANPDGDALGSAAALAGLLLALGKEARIYNASGVPAFMDWLALPCPLIRSMAELGDFAPDWTFVLDCGDLPRLGPDFAASASALRIANIDHHLANPMFGEENWVDPTQAAVGCMVAELAHEFGVPLAGDIGEAVYLAIISDTGQFSYGNTTPQVMALASEILRQGLDAGAFTAKSQNVWTLTRMRLWSSALAEIRLHCGGAVGVLAISREMMRDAGASKEDCEGLVEAVRRIRGVRMAITLREEVEGQVRISLRSFGADNVQAVARQFGGGGHKNASGATYFGPLADAEAALVDAMAAELGLPKTPCVSVKVSCG